MLACTHYPLLIARFKAVAPWAVDWLDPALAIARRVAELLRDRPPRASAAAAPKIAFTSGHVPAPALAKGLAAYGF